MNRKEHWNHVYETKSPDQVSWFQAEARLSFELITRESPSPQTAILDVGAGASVLIDQLLEAGYYNLAVLDVSAAALSVLRTRLTSRFGNLTDNIKWIESDVLEANITPHKVDVWHDRAVFHFLTNPDDRAAYINQLRNALVPNGIVIVATFAEDGPLKCSGLETMRYTAETLSQVMGPDFQLVSSDRELHLTPTAAVQAFTYCVFQYVGASVSQSRK